MASIPPFNFNIQPTSSLPPAVSSGGTAAASSGGLNSGYSGNSSSLSASKDPEFLESENITLEWTVHNLKQLFENSKGDSKSRVVKSALFGEGRWQLLFYPNAGSPNSEHCSLYLSCEPQAHEFEDGVPVATGGKWVRRGKWHFQFRLTSSENKTICMKEALADHTFASKTANWGWTQYGKRDIVYFNNSLSRSSDCFTITCCISSSPDPPAPPPLTLEQNVPLDLMQTVGRLLDDRKYSDVEFVITKRKGRGEGRSIWANKTLLARVEHFATLLSSGFAEDIDTGDAVTHRETLIGPSLEDSDASDAGESDYGDLDEGELDEDELEDLGTASGDGVGEGAAEGEQHLTTQSLVENHEEEEEEEEEQVQNEHIRAESDGEGEGGSKAREKTETKSPSGTRSLKVSWQGRAGGATASSEGPRKTTIAIGDASYPTFYALLYYLYTNQITFAPLTSSFASTSGVTATLSDSTSSPTFLSPTRLRKNWIASWVRSHPGRPEPASAKSIFVLSDLYGLADLKQRAFKHIVASLTVHNIAHEAFSAFSAAYDVVRKVEVDFFLTNWKAIRDTEAMAHVWTSVRSGRHRGFEEVWPLIVSNLEYVPGSGRDEGEESKP